MCESDLHAALQVQRMAAMRAATAASQVGRQCLLWAVPEGGWSAEKLDAALHPMAARSPYGQFCALLEWQLFEKWAPTES